ncbi:MAG: hypothetical protein AVDCRST_MAG20-1956 [uncultured Acidimicrobiales bacterium]|uniref:Uncharacterized protein n=1 Tax=uncultured Acidimicrobiales bacterium TaxID=310071 RepID=A0A6J4I8R1_9ACTN|nr:MAG: hypothetical protein AVDCRST_MAG20-1956 [uncultured Acidimicrobiales bacterium]
MATPEHPSHPADPAGGDGDVRDELPDDLDASGYVGPYTFPDNSRRRIPGVLYLLVGAACGLAWALAGDDAVLVNDGFLVVGLALSAFGAYCLLAGTRLGVDETEALVAATRTAGFAVGHASAQLGWRGLRSRPTWRILLYSAEEPPEQRGLVLVDGIDGEVLEHFVEDNPEDPAEWAELASPAGEADR